MDLPEPLDDAPHHLLPVPLLRRPRRHLELGLQAGRSGPLRAQETDRKGLSYRHPRFVMGNLDIASTETS